ncbi:unnamed protein product [Closterium sp. Naga37s-1]|nr:unnamed protein product [Closterium sp. Naga37s-1]
MAVHPNHQHHHLAASRLHHGRRVSPSSQAFLLSFLAASSVVALAVLFTACVSLRTVWSISLQAFSLQTSETEPFAEGIVYSGESLALREAVASWRSRVVYHVFVDRFAPPKPILSEQQCATLSDYCGGTFTGMRQHLPYIRGMGFDALLIGPVTVNSPYGYHGYWPRGFAMPRGAGGKGAKERSQTAINPHLGTPEELKALVDAAHAMGFLVMIDVVLNHVGCPQGGGPCDTWQEGIRRPPWLNDSYAPFNESASFHPPCEVDFSQYDADNWQHCWLASLPDFNQSNPAVAAALVKSTAYLVHTFSFDAIRVDAAHHMPPEFVRSLASHLRVPAFAELSIPLLPLPHRLLAGRAYTNHATAELQQALQLAMVRAFTGGNTGSDEFTHSPAAGYTVPAAPAASSAPTFPALPTAAASAAATGATAAASASADAADLAGAPAPPVAPAAAAVRVASAEAATMVELARAMAAVFEGAGNADFQGSFLDNHDSPRLLCLLYGDQLLLRNALVLLLTTRGIPLVYSGTEQAFMGGPDPQNRESLWPFLNTHHPLYGFLAAVNRFRHKVSLWQYKQQHIRFVSTRLLVFQRGPVVVAVTNSPADAEAVNTVHVTGLNYRDGTILCNQLVDNECIRVVLLGAGMLTALVLPRPIALALTAAALLPPILRTALHSWHWSRARKGGSGGGTSGGKGERGEKGELKAEGIKGGVGAEREGLLGEVLFEPDKTMANGKENGVGGRHEAAASANVLSVNGIDIFQGRMAGKMDGDFCLFLIGARANNPFPMGPAFPSVGEVFNQAVRELEQESERFGYLGGDHYVGTDVTRGSQTIAVMYWRSYDHLVSYANDQNLVHGSAWKRMTQLLRDGPDIGVWHESYAIKAGQYESIYVNCPAFGLGAAGRLVPAAGPLSTSRGRMREGGGVKRKEVGEDAAKLPGEKVGSSRCPMGF